MAERSIILAYLNEHSVSISDALINSNTDGFTIKLVTDVVTAATATNAALTEVTGTNYTAGGLPLSTSVTGTPPVQLLETSTAITWPADPTGFSGANSAMLWDSTASRYVAFMDIRNTGVAIGSTSDPVTITLVNGTDLVQLGVAP